MMEIVEKSNFRFKALVIALVTVILASTCTASLGFSLFNSNKDETEPYLNRKVEFTGDTHYYSDGSAKKISVFHKGETVRKTYTQENPGCGIISIVRRDAKYPYYVSGEGWIAKEQVKDAQRFIQLDVNGVEDGLNTKLHINGEYLDVQSDNTGVVKFENDTLVAGIDGTTTVTLTKKDGEKVELMTAVVDGNLEVNIPEKAISTDVKTDVVLLNKKVEIKAEGNAEAALIVEDDGLKIAADGTGKAELYVKDQKVAECDTQGNIELQVNKEELKIQGEAEQRISALDRLTVKLQEKGSATVDKTHAEAEVEAKAEANDKELAEGKAAVNYNYSDEDPTGSVNAKVLEKEVVNVENKTIPIISGLKALIARIRR